MTASKSAILAEVVNRSSAPKDNKIEIKGDFPEQDNFIKDPERYIVAQCSRRSGKTTGLIYRFIKTMERYPKSQCLYVALTFESAKEIMWVALMEVNDQYKLGLTFTESKLQVKHPNGAILKLVGADQKNFIKRLRGRKYPGVGIDEAQDFGTHLQSLIDDILTPSIADYEDSWLALTGTPGPVPQGYFFDITQNSKYGYSKHMWTIMQNPHMPNPQAFLNDLKIKREWTNDNPTLRREWLNHWVLDAQSLWVRYNENVNHFDELPKEHKWNYIMGVDIGFNDADAIAIIGWSETSPVTYLVEEQLTKKQGLTELVEQMNIMQKKYDCSKVVMDEGGLGKKLAEEVRRRHSINVEPADKVRKQENVELLNDSLRLGRFKANKQSQFAKDSYLVQIDWDKSTPSRIIIKKKPHSDIIDAVLYAFKESYAFTYQPPKPVGSRWGTKEWAEAQTNSMFERELEGHIKEREDEMVYNKWLLGED